ncbi:MAG: lytic transglycosylase domain-containing protein [Spirochaetota bacterium]
MSTKLARTIQIILSFLLIGKLAAFDETDYLIKSMQWKRIYRTINSSNLKNETEAYALIRYHESSGAGSSKEKLKLLYGVVTGLKPIRIGSTEITYLLQKKTKPQTTILRLCFWKLYWELQKKKLLPTKEKITYLRKLQPIDDPIFHKVYNEIQKIYFERKRYDKIIKNSESIKKKPDRQFLYTHRVQRYYAYSLIKESRVAAGKQVYISLLQDPQTPYTLKKQASKDLKNLLGKNFHATFNLQELASVINLLDRSAQIAYIDNKTFANTRFTNLRLVKNVLHTYLYRDTDKLFPFLKNHKQLIRKNPDSLLYIVGRLISRQRHSLAKKLLDSYLYGMDLEDVHKNYTRIFTHYNRKSEATFKALLNYLHLYPYNLYYQDVLLDFLTDQSGSRIKYRDNKYWQQALDKIPNLPVKGRLVYWYLRYLKQTSQNEKLKQVLASFYKLCPGSYYLEVIKAEFAAELKKIKTPNNPLKDKNSLLSYLSLKKLEVYARELNRKDLSFAYYRGARQLSDKLIDAYKKIDKNKKLEQAVSYLKIGELSYGMAILKEYAREKQYTPGEKYELFVGAGDISGQTYVSLYYTRQLMKFYLLADDPLLLPEAITARLYPRPHRALVKKNTKRYPVDENVIYAVMRQESFFRENAVSSAKAKGLMQVIPSTGKGLAKALKVKQYSLHDPEVSIRFGTKFLFDLLNSYNRDLRWASIAYNGGPGNLRKWKRNHYRGDFNQFLENLPSRESRNYCRIVISNYINYRTLMLVNEVE